MPIENLPTGRYSTVVVDPPWPIQKIVRRVRPNQTARLDYPTMSVAEIQALPVNGLLDDDAFVFLWTTQRFLPTSFDVVKAWGLTYRFQMVWHKPGGIQPYGLPQYNGEFVTVAVKGDPDLIDAGTDFPAVFNARRGAHSEKPQIFYDMLTGVTRAPRLDMFARRRIEGFDAWGDEAPARGDDAPQQPVLAELLASVRR